MLHLHDFHHVQINGFIGFSNGQHSIYYSLRKGKSVISHLSLMLWLKCPQLSYVELHHLMSYLSEQIRQLCVDLSPEGGACDVDEGLSVHFPCHLHLFQNSQGFVFCRLKALSNDSWMETLQQEIKWKL